MPHYILKPRPERDFYIDWSTVVDRPADWGSREMLSAELDGRSAAPERFDRADETGTSSLVGELGWGAEEIVVHNIEGGPVVVRRVDLEAFCGSLNYDDPAHPYDPALARPWMPEED
ncbi:hypothetical protein ACF1AJ_20700 [Leifsonia sp. NPDC014704]|uniref:hypothetical protein n=1 Tax=Leifsonia sp. NPDC014704 TaxID=3364123 RepID=UPI0036F470C1